jgi:VanZ family protein
VLYNLFSWLRNNSFPAITWTVLILVACSWPGSNLPDSPVIGFDKVVHVGLFAGMAFLWSLRYPKQVAQVILAGIAYGIFIEIYQKYMPINRSFDWWDILADSVGVVVGVITVIVFQKYVNV